MPYNNYTSSLGWPAPGVMSVPAYQVSGVPWVTSSIAPNNGVIQVNFPNGTRWLEVNNTGGVPLRVGFTQNGTVGNPANQAHYFTIPTAGAGTSTSTRRWELRCSRVYLYGEGGTCNFSLMASLTGVPSRYLNDMSGSLGGVFNGIG